MNDRPQADLPELADQLRALGIHLPDAELAEMRCGRSLLERWLKAVRDYAHGGDGRKEPGA